MGRAFEYRKGTKLKRWGNIAREFTKLGKQITISVKKNGPDPNVNSRLRVLIRQSKKENMPKENIERAIKKALSIESSSNYKEALYEGYGPFGIAIILETLTDNPTRTVANIRSYFNKYGGSLGTNGSVQFLFEQKCIIKVLVKKEVELEGLELKLIDFGANEVEWNKKKNIFSVYCRAQNYLGIQNYLEENQYKIYQVEFVHSPINRKEVTKEQRVTLEKLFKKFEEDEDIHNIFHTMNP